MKKLWYGLLLAVACTAGCWQPFLVPPSTMPTKVEDSKKSARSARPPMLVTPDQVNENNAHEIGRALEEELGKAQSNEQ